MAFVIACSHYHSPIVQYGTVQRSDLAKSRLDDLCCMRTIPRWKRLALGFPTMYGSVGVGMECQKQAFGCVLLPVTHLKKIHCEYQNPHPPPCRPPPENSGLTPGRPPTARGLSSLPARRRYQNSPGAISNPQSSPSGNTGNASRLSIRRWRVSETKGLRGWAAADELQRLTICSADPTAPHQSGTPAAIPAHRCVGRELVRGATPGRLLCAATGCGRCPSARRRRSFTNQFTPAR
jgi:hypothetical protein